MKKVVNNNIVCATDDNGEEVILRGLGIGFSKKANEIVAEEAIEKVYRMDGAKSMNKLQELLEEIPLSYVEVCTDIIDHAKEVLNRRLNSNIYITLTDHISFAIARKKENMEYKNAMLSEIKCFYPQEYNLGVEALSIIEQRLGVRLSIDEAGFIALHIVNAQLDTNMSSMVQITELIQKILEIVTEYYHMEFDEDSLHYSRFITHLKFFGQRLFKNKETTSDDVVFQEMIKKQYPKDYECAKLIQEHISKTYNRKITEEEMMFLTVHLRRISM
ncbi:MAG: PRD domain-containing protein [Clostridiales bacterium]|nr:PRD domain-containing protein [Clostridiales bacterium]